MQLRPSCFLALIVGLAVALSTSTLHAADEKPTTIAIPGLHCAGCAKKVTDKLATLSAVAKAETNMTAKTIKVTAKPGKTLSPKELWETVEKAEQTPTKLEGPKGTFTEKPKS